MTPTQLLEERPCLRFTWQANLPKSEATDPIIRLATELARRRQRASQSLALRVQHEARDDDRGRDEEKDDTGRVERNDFYRRVHQRIAGREPQRIDTEYVSIIFVRAVQWIP